MTATARVIINQVVFTWIVAPPLAEGAFVVGLIVVGGAGELVDAIVGAIVSGAVGISTIGFAKPETFKL